MLVLQVSLNGQRLCTAAIRDGSVGAFVDITDLTMPDGQLFPASLRVFGIEDFVNLHWRGAEQLAVGDEVSIRVLADVPVDEPRRQPRKDGDAEEAQERLNYLRLKQKYEGRSDGAR
jgi:hypothetical protein